MITHADLIEASTNLLADSTNVSRWFSLYDEALASETDRELKQLVNELLAERIRYRPLAA